VVITWVWVQLKNIVREVLSTIFP